MSFVKNLSEVVFYSALKDLPLRKTVESYGDIGEQMRAGADR